MNDTQPGERRARSPAKVMVCAGLAALGGCVTGGERYDSLRAMERDERYRSCMSAQMDHQAFGTAMYVHQSCREWANRKH